jgi:hypothetical protein
VTVRRRTRGELGADDAVSTRAVVDDRLLPEPVAHLLREKAAEDVVAAARRERHYQANRLGREPACVGSLRRRSSARAEEAERTELKSVESGLHGEPRDICDNERAV